MPAVVQALCDFYSKAILTLKKLLVSYMPQLLLQLRDSFLCVPMTGCLEVITQARKREARARPQPLARVSWTERARLSALDQASSTPSRRAPQGGSPPVRMSPPLALLPKPGCCDAC